MTETLKILEEKPNTSPIATVPAPPQPCVTHLIAYLKSLIDKGRYPPAGWIESLEVIEQALLTNEAAQLEVIAQTDITQVAAIDPSGVDITAFVGSAVTVETLTMLYGETERRYGDCWQLFAEPVESSDLWRVQGVKAKPSRQGETE